MEFEQNSVGDPSSSSFSHSVPPMPIDSSNIGFQLLKKHGWKEGTGLGASEQGRLEPVEAYVKKNKHGLGVDKGKKKSISLRDSGISVERNKYEDRKLTKKEKQLSKRIKKMLEVEKQIQEREFERQFFRDFWPDNV
ncbi:hypothetical protein Droror1_Dr00002798 [Drosera rotundifolia]